MALGGLLKPNPALSKGFSNVGAVPGRQPMTIDGTVRKTALLLVVLIAAAAAGWQLPVNVGTPIAIVGAIGALVVAFVTAFKPYLSKYLAIPYAVLEGGLVGVVSRVYNDQFDGIVFTAAGLTIAILCALLLAYKSKLIRPTENFKLAVTAATAGIALFYLVTLAVGMFGVHMPLVNSSSGFGIAFSVFVVVLAAANLVLDFDFIEEGVNRGADKDLEWFGALGLLITLVWLYLELLRLLAKLQDRR
jgi:uncharacterized YccA/Bax inhibitor family protein